MSDERDRRREIAWERIKLRLAYAAETRGFEIERLWQRALFFWTVLGSAFVGYGVIEGKSARASLMIACFGLVAALAWTLQNRGAKYWQEAWEQKTNRHQHAALGIDLFKFKENVDSKGWFGAARYSVSRLAIILSDFTVLVWVGLTGRSLYIAFSSPDARPAPCLAAVIESVVHWSPLILVAITLGWCIILLRYGRSERP